MCRGVGLLFWWGGFGRCFFYYFLYLIFFFGLLIQRAEVFIPKYLHPFFDFFVGIVQRFAIAVGEEVARLGEDVGFDDGFAGYYVEVAVL